MQLHKGLIAIAVLAAAMPAFAQTYNKVTSKVALDPTDSIDWGQRNNNAAVPSGTDFTSSVFGIKGTVAISHPGKRIDAGSGPADWAGGFLPGEALLWTQANGPLTILFADLGLNGVYGVGTQVWFNYPPSRDASIDLLGDGGSILQSFAYSTGGGFDDNLGQASFIGGTSSSGNIKGIRFNNASEGIEQGDFAINQLSLKPRGVDGGNTGGGGEGAVPEPGEWAAMGILGAGLAGLVIRKRRNG